MRSKHVQLQMAVVSQARRFIAEGIEAYDGLVEAVSDHDTYLDQLLDARGAHNNQPTSVEGAMDPPRLGTVRRRIIDEIRTSSAFHVPQGLTDDELERRLCRNHTTVSSARNWLVNAGWLHDSEYRRRTFSGREAIVWTLTPAARAAIASPEWVERSKTSLGRR